jgi:hypothetical protein
MGLIHVTQNGPTTIIGFDIHRVPEDERFTQVQDEVMRLFHDHCRKLAFDLTGVRVIPSQLLGLMAWLCRNKVEVSVYNASDEIRETLAFTQLDTIIDVRDGTHTP